VETGRPLILLERCAIGASLRRLVSLDKTPDESMTGVAMYMDRRSIYGEDSGVTGAATTWEFPGTCASLLPMAL